MADIPITDTFNFYWSTFMNESEKSNGVVFEEKHCCIADTRDANFEKTENRLSYLYKFSYFNILYIEKCISDFIAQNCEAKNIFVSESLKICSLSNGPGIDIVGLLLSLCKSNIHLNCIPSLNIINLHQSWQDSFKRIVNAAYRSYCKDSKCINIPSEKLNYIQSDIYSSISTEVQNCICDSDVLLMHGVFQSCKATLDKSTNALKEIFYFLKPGAYIFYVGSKKTKDILKDDFVKKLVKCIFGPTEISLENLPLNQSIFDAINVKPKQSGKAVFVVWEKKSLLEEINLSSLLSKKTKKKVRRRRNKKAKNMPTTNELVDNKSVDSELEDYETDENSEISFTSCSVQSDALSSTSAVANQVSQCMSYQNLKSDNSAYKNKMFNSYQPNLFQFEKENVETETLGNKNCVLPVHEVHTFLSEKMLTCIKQQQPIMNKENQIECLNRSEVHAQNQAVSTDINFKEVILREGLQHNTTQSITIQKLHPTEINLASVDDKKRDGIISQNGTVNVLSSLDHQVQYKNSVEKNISKVNQSTHSSENVTISEGINEQNSNKLRISGECSYLPKTQVFSHKALNSKLSKVDQQRAKTLQNKTFLNSKNNSAFLVQFPMNADQGDDDSQKFDTLFKNCESLVNTLEELIDKLKNKECLQNEQSSNQKKCCCILQQDRFKNQHCKFCCRCMAYSQCCSSDSCCRSVNSLGCFPTSEYCKICVVERYKSNSEANASINDTPYILIPVKNENLSQILPILLKHNAA